MRIRVLGCSGAESPGHFTTSFLVDDTLLLDAGTIGAVLTDEEQARISAILLTHRHLDHLKSLPLLADTLIMQGTGRSVTVFGTADTLQAVRTHLLNDIIWPDFSQLPTPLDPIIRFEEITVEQPFSVAGITVTAFPVHHTVPAVGYILRRGECGILYTGDTGPTNRIWERGTGLRAAIIEVSFPNELEELALRTGHLTARLLARELEKLPEAPERILVTHPKPLYFDTITAELAEMGIPRMELLREGDRYEF